MRSDPISLLEALAGKRTRGRSPTIGAASANASRQGTKPASTPFTAMLNYAYAILENPVSMQIVAKGLDPTIGFLHTSTPERQALVLDLVLEFVQAHTGAMAFARLILRWLDGLLSNCALQGDRNSRSFSPEVKEITC